MNDIDLQESDKLEGTNHPRHTNVIYGHDIPQLDFLNVYNSKRLHHAWMTVSYTHLTLPTNREV